MDLPRRDRLSLGVQRALGWVCFPLLGGLAVAVMRLGLGYRVPDLRGLRRRARRLLGRERAPLLICANHLTLVDSAVIAWSLASNWTYWRHFRRFPWNLPERRNFAHNAALRTVCYLLKCVPVVRGAPAAQTKRTLDRLRHLLRRGEALLIFPEGTRSPDGRVNTESFGYGVGRLLQEVAGARVLCVYQRGRGQATKSALPKRGESFDTDLALIRPASETRGLRGAREISTQIVQKLHEMEQHYFATRALHRQ